MSIDWFSFEDKDYDFPFYNKNPYIPKWGWIILFVVLVFGGILTISEKIHIATLSCIVLIVPVLYFLKWDYKAIFRIPSRRDVVLAVTLFVGYIIYAIVMSTLLEQVGIVSSGLIEKEAITFMTIFSSIFSLMSEEFIKFIPFMFFLRVIYKYTENRKIAVIIAVAITMTMFASIHAYNFIMFLFALCIQGFGSIFEFYGYIKTKNILVSYLTHLCTDVFIFSIAIIG